MLTQGSQRAFGAQIRLVGAHKGHLEAQMGPPMAKLFLFRASNRLFGLTSVAQLAFQKGASM